MVMVSVAVKGLSGSPPPWSLVVISKLPFSLRNSGNGVNVNPSKAWLIAERVPVKVRVSVFSPVTSTASVFSPGVTVPLVATIVTTNGSSPASGSAMVIALSVSVLNTSGVSVLVAWVSGTLLLGGSLTPVTVMVTVAVAVLPISSATV